MKVANYNWGDGIQEDGQPTYNGSLMKWLKTFIASDTN